MKMTYYRWDEACATLDFWVPRGMYCIDKTNYSWQNHNLYQTYLNPDLQIKLQAA